MAGFKFEGLSKDVDRDRWFESLDRYIFCNYKHLLTESEWAGWSYLMLLKKRQYDLEIREHDVRSPGSRVVSGQFNDRQVKRIEERREKWIEEWRTTAFKDPKIKLLLEEYPDKFYFSVSNRILRDHPDDIFLNLCQICLNLCRTPRAKQCLRCGYS